MMAGYSESEPVKNEKGCWYEIIMEECPVCGGGSTYRTRKPPPAPAPDDWQKRYKFEQHYDWCDW